MVRGAKRVRALVACAAGALAIFTDLGAAEAQTSTRSVAQVERDRRAEAARAERLRSQAEAARDELNALDARMVQSAARRAEAEAAATAAEERLAALRAQMDADSSRRAHARDGFEAALIAAAFTERRVEPRMVRIGIFARAAAPEFHAEERRSTQALADGAQSAAAIGEEQVILAEAEASIDAERSELTTLVARRRTTQARLVSDAAAAERRVRTLAAEARTLRELAARVERASARRARPAGPSAIPAAWSAPAEGQIVRGFGSREGQGPASQGAVLRTRAGAQVLSPATGEVAYAGTFRSYGQVLILNLEGGYVLVLTGLDASRVAVGDRVRAGQPVGEMPESATTAPELYVEVRREGRPLDPGRWLAARGLTAGREVRTG